MAEEPEISLPTEQPRHCPVCGARVALQASSCLMCGTVLVEEESFEEEAPERRGLPSWARILILALGGAAILVVGGFWLLKLPTATPDELDSTGTPVATPTASSTPTPTRTLMPTRAPTSIPPLAHEVQSGETLSSIAAQYNTTVEDILAANPGVVPELLQPGDVLKIPVTSYGEGPFPTLDPDFPTPEGGYVVYRVEQGDTLGSIAERYGVSVTSIIIANEDLLVSGEDTVLFPGQALIIPISTPMPSPTPTIDPNATPTPIPPYAPPPLLSPPDGAMIVGSSAPILLQWASVGVLRGDEWYEVTVFQPPSGIVSSTLRTRATAWRVPFDLLSTAEAEEGVRVFRWWVQVVREARSEEGITVYEEAGLPSQERTFVWLAPTPTPTVTPSPASTP